MTNERLQRLRSDLAAQFQAGASTDEIEEWADAYTFGRRDLIDLLRLEWRKEAEPCQP